MPTILAIDQSTSATKALLFDETGKALDRESRPHRQIYPQPGWVEHDAEEIWQNTLSVATAVYHRATQANRSPVCLSLTNQRETIVIFDRATGRPLAPALVWQDRRGDAICAEQARLGVESRLKRKTGLKLDAYFSGSKLRWLMEHRPELRAKLASGEALVGTIDAYLVYRLTAGQVFATDHTNASRTLLFDIARLDWDDELCDLWLIPRRALPSVRESTARFGETAFDGALSHPLPICGVMGDSQASLFAHRCYRPGDTKVTFGTGSSVLLNIGPEPEFLDEGVVTTLAWVHRGAPTYAFEGIIISSAATLAWLINQLGFAKDATEIEALAASVPDNGGVYLVPAFSGLGLPHWRPEARAAIVGLSGHSDRRHLARAAVESMAYQLRDVLEALRGYADVSLTSVHADGGPTANTTLMQFTADITGLELRVPSAPDCSPLGAAFAGALGLGIYSSLDELSRLPQPETVFRPAKTPEEIEAVCAGWAQAVESVIGKTAPVFGRGK